MTDDTSTDDTNESSTESSQYPDDLPLRHDLTSVSTFAVTEYGLSPEEIAATMREKADEIEDDTTISRYHASMEADK